MDSIILQYAYKPIKWIFLTFAIIALLRGHNYPGGGFIGGLLASIPFVYKGLAFNFQEIKSTLNKRPKLLIGLGLTFIVLSFFPSIINGVELMRGYWFALKLPFGQELKLGTPFLFDIGIFLVVIGVTLMIIISLIKEKLWK